MKYLYLALLGATTAYADFDIQKAIDAAKPGTAISIPTGTYRTPIQIKQGLTLSGENVVLEVESNQPAILIDARKPVLIKGLTIKYRTERKPKKDDTPYAVFIRNGDIEIIDSTFTALGNGPESPGAISAQDKSEVDISNCSFNGFEYTIQIWNGAEGDIEDCLIMNPGHCGITIGSGSSAELTRNIVTGSRYHGIRCTGGEIEADSNLVIRNKNRGFYIGNRSAIGEISNNLIIDNATGINVFARSKLEIDHNVIVRSSYAGLAIADTAQLEIEDNIIVDNERGIVGFSSEKGRTPRVHIEEKNLMSGNKIASENAELSSKISERDPSFSDSDKGLFKSAVDNMGLENPEELQALWMKWQSALDNR
ncbi:right-handed parallel beta-helix repeat-containing protein [Pontiella agarivorans]|uniref:Right-handed parallel beta-helix repeat-containing protein n=1 Tax=Pontiella agarivorans TaxID=3038953 RepID=A0ABU5MUS8_9BACT|nr:right-handed parallel beta-helix repeat-containing protein [Pontiella agarivorans]MDZ8117968.1 right-handed parallel beta-helix repeat-containing protein [Pontiella agarivorans]